MTTRNKKSDWALKETYSGIDNDTVDSWRKGDTLIIQPKSTEWKAPWEVHIRSITSFVPDYGDLLNVTHHIYTEDHVDLSIHSSDFMSYSYMCYGYMIFKDWRCYVNSYEFYIMYRTQEIEETKLKLTGYLKFRETVRDD